MKTLSPLTVARLGFALLAVTALGAVYSLDDALRPEKMLTIAVKEGVEGVALKKVAERFSKEHGVTVKIKEFPYSELFKQELKQAGSDQPSEFDVIMVDDPWVPALLAAGDNHHAGDEREGYRLKRLEKETYAQDDGLKDFVGWTLKVAKSCPHDDVCDDYYGVPFVGNSQLFCYNTRDFQHRPPPRTWEEVKQASANLEKGRLGYVTRVGSSNSIVTDFMPILWSYDGKSFPLRLDAKDGVFGQENHNDAVAAFVSLAELARKQKASGVSVDDFDVATFLAEDRASMGIVWSAWAMSLVSVVNAEGGTSIQCSNLPGQRPELGVWLLAIPSTARMRDEAEEFVKYATSRKQLLIAATEGNPPARGSLLESVLNVESDVKEKDHTKADQGSSGEGRTTHKKYAAPCSPEEISPGEYQNCLIQRIGEQYGRLFASQLASLEQARPRPRTKCWREMETALGDHLQALIVADEGSSEPLYEAAEKAVSRAQDAINPLIENCQSATMQTQIAAKQH